MLTITVTPRTPDDMRVFYSFTEQQNAALDELLTAANREMWNSLLYGSSGEIVAVALSQVGNVGGQPYWSWYGFNSRVEWCACFVSWCANECGYIDAGVIPKFAGAAPPLPTKTASLGFRGDPKASAPVQAQPSETKGRKRR